MGDIELKHPNTEEVTSDLIGDSQGNLKVMNNKPDEKCNRGCHGLGSRANGFPAGRAKNDA